MKTHIWMAALWLGFAPLAMGAAPAAAPADVAVTAALPGQTGVTYESLLRQAIPGLAVAADGSWTAPEIPGLRFLDGASAEGTEISFTKLQALTVASGGKPVLLLLTQGDDGFSALLTAFDLSAPAPRLLDIVAAGMDRATDLGTTLKLADGTDAFTLKGYHLNAGEEYAGTQIAFLHDGKLAPIAFQLAYSVMVCGWQTIQTATYDTVEDPKSPYRAVSVSVTEETLLSGEDCGEGTTLPRAGKRTLTDLYHWDAAKGVFTPATHNLDALPGPG